MFDLNNGDCDSNQNSLFEIICYLLSRISKTDSWTFKFRFRNIPESSASVERLFYCGVIIMIWRARLSVEGLLLHTQSH